ncbi:uncharacterized protein [Linepithema humile]|uniref:uncharacterized protein isoform X2 n=1 Tax=Linepithema humile TaxID=83485 RepID=UPI000623A9E0|nr:PREDICTED: uncharacterized protein LOC105679364 isoform X2 [Linepithema humile]XP_012234769.1 PREDICTED: uncharacterized protein LOC105679364 isoform X2 [Linepithema humile]XP_012234770.1 PREDICTED: uncharacterized protein LOC105679364 isoform X2 [Linepithema humile]XP_012234771.1 PREDICTED: uncharacterized protein LOC105679364 isoform X2 [Linepithema humile]XP_012234772.1 PREDICTED: uncharacterized protein LOC105679364 isoform X2 [Linepithema humile]XP_012234773.1 PREDICTED: uncharacterize
MGERVKAVEKCYFDLKYNKSKQKALKEISILTKNITISNVINIADRLLETASIIEKNLSLFQSVFKHIDTVSTIIQFLQHFGNTKQMACKAIDEFDVSFLNDLWDALYTLFYICPDHEMQLFLHTAILEDSNIISAEDAFYKNIHRDNYKQLFSCQTIDMIIYKDSDFHAVVNQLKITGTRMNKIWIHKSIQEQFTLLLNKYFKQSLNHHIRVFQTKEELLTLKEINKISIMSIWSEDITGAKSLAASLKRDIIFINTHMDFCGGLVFLPYMRLFQGPLHQFLLSNLDLYKNASKSDRNTSKKVQIFNLFYNGTWHKPVKGKYWIHDDSLWANATIEDASKCIQSAEQGLKIYNTWSTESREQSLLKFASILENKGEDTLSSIILNTLKFVYYSELPLQCLQIGRLEVKITYMPRGIIILEDNSQALRNLIINLIYGNSVIITHDRSSFSHSFVKYCDVFSHCQIPPGVINILSGENIEHPNNVLNKVSISVKELIAYFIREKKIVLPLE